MSEPITAMTGPFMTLDPWKRLRALTDVVQEQQKEGEHLDRKVRFALVVMGLLNGAVLVGLRGGWPSGGGGSLFLLALALVDGYFFLHVVEALTPRLLVAPRPGHGLRSSVDIATADAEGYHRAWQEVDLDTLLGELARQAHALGTANLRKATTIRRLFLSLHLITVLAAACLWWTALR